MKLQILLLVFLLGITATGLQAQEEKVDAGIFSGQTPDTIIIKARPNYSIPGQSITNSQLTIKWSESSPVTSLQWLNSPIGLFPQGQIVVSDGFRYQVYGSFGGSSLNWAAGEEYPILRLKTNTQTGECTEFEIALDEWTIENNGDYYIEILGDDKTGIIYKPAVNFGSDGGYINCDTTIYLGNSTGIMQLEDYNGNVIHWERNINQGAWEILPETAGVDSLEDMPTLEGVWSYRVKVEKTGCPPDYSIPAYINVELLSIWTGVVSNTWEDPGNWNIAGVPETSLDAKVPEVGSGFYPVIVTDAYCKNLIIDENASLTVSRLGTLEMSGTLENNGMFIMQSDPVSSGCLLDQGISGEGIFSSNLEFWPATSYHLFSCPVINATTSAFDNMNLYSWDEPSGSYVFMVPGNDTINTIKGFLAKSSDTVNDLINFEGNGLSTGQYSINLTNNGSNDGHAGGFNLIGNPYPSAINWNNEENLILEQLDPVIYVLDGESGNYGTYIRHDERSRTMDIDSIIGVHQGFFVHVNHNHTFGSFTINNQARLKENKPLRKKHLTLSQEPYLKLKIMDPSYERYDQVVVRFKGNATSGFDSQFDAYDLNGFSDSPQLFSRCDDTLRLAVNTYPPLEINTSIPLGFQAAYEGIYHLLVEELLNLGSDTIAMLEDLMEDTTYRLLPAYSLSFQASPWDNPDRFVLHFLVEPVNVTNTIPSGKINLFVSGNRIIIDFPENKSEVTLEMYDITGRLILREKISESKKEVEYKTVPGIYIVRVITPGGLDTRKVFLGAL